MKELAPNFSLSHYRIVSKIGAGGMGEVYLAQDTKLDRKVALKILPADFSDDDSRMGRFIREAKSVSALNHPNILTIHEIGEESNQHYISTEFISGETLRHRIDRGQLPVLESIEIASQIGAALNAAHEAGIVHRDIKPENVMIRSDGLVKVLDFGLAKLTAGTSIDPESETRIQSDTQPGMIMGTVAYMSPQQARGKTVDARTDVWSLGVVIYEMVSGSQPFRGETMTDTLANILHRDPEPLNIDHSGLAQIVNKMLGKNVETRYSTVSEAVIELKRLQKEIEFQAELQRKAPEMSDKLQFVDVPVAESGDKLTPDINNTSLNPHTRTIAVLPFQNLSRDPEHEFFADGITEEILNALAQIAGLRVAGRSSSFSFKGRNEDLRSVGAQLNVENILEGTLRRSGDRLRLTAQLIDVASGYQLWSERYDRVIEDVFTVQDEIAATIAGRLQLSLNAESETQQPGTRHLGAYELYLKGRALLYQRGLSIPKAIDCFKQAVSLDPSYAQAWAGLADGYTTYGYSGFKPAIEVMPLALEAARRALELDENLAEAHNALAAPTQLYERNYDLARREFLRALELNPNYPQARSWYGLFYLQWIEGDDLKARAELSRLLRIDPLSAYANVILSFFCSSSNRYAEAVEHGRRGVELDPNSYLAQWSLSVALEANAQYEEAVVAVERALAVSGRHAWALTTLASIYGAWGRSDDARAVYRELEVRRAREYIQPSMLAIAASAIDEMDQAIEFAQAAVDERDPLFVMVARVWPQNKKLRTDSRFRQIVGQLGLPDWDE